MSSSLMRKLTYATITGFILFALSFVFITGLVTATNGIAAAEGSPKEIFPQPYFELLISLAIGFIPLADVIWQHTKDKETEASEEATNKTISTLSGIMNGFVETIKELKKDKTGRAGLHRRRRSSGRYDPDPRRRSHRGHRKGVEPAGLKRWRLSHRRTHDPGYARSFSKGPRGGHYFHGPRKNRYDPPKRRRFSGARRAGGKLEHGLSKYGGFIGAGISALVGVFQGFSDYQKAYGPSAGRNYLATIIGGDIYNSAGVKTGTRTPEISKLWGTNDGLWGAPRGPLDYLKYKFLGLDTDGTYKGSAWVYPFWGGVIATLAGPIARLFTHKGQRFLRPLHKIGVGLVAMSTVGALALPGCPKPGEQVNGQVSLPPPPTNQNNMKIRGAF